MTPATFPSGAIRLRPEPYGGRNYTLFAALSDVRNGFGFAGVPTATHPAVRGPPGAAYQTSLARHFR